VTRKPGLPTGRNFGRKTQKWPHKNLSGRKKQRPNFWPISQKMAEKWPNFFGVCTSHKALGYLKKYTGQPMGSLHYFCYQFEAEVLVKQALRKDTVCGRIFSPAAELFS
jgi:hypothetical protein